MLKVSVLFVCRANICRSPIAEGIFKEKLKQSTLEKHVKVDSAGVLASSIRCRPDARAQKVTLENGVNIAKLKSRKFREKDFKYDYILVMDSQQLTWLSEKYPDLSKGKVHLLRSYSKPLESEEVPDPYYGNIEGFRAIYHLLDCALDDFLEAIKQDVKS
ncbi:low molecular weight protein-tyrosine-phosphatase [Pseudomaricurvus sp.]|uniref:low molecular weight protein-tyrosine-phosphatase n=1 Tax=Pseudomaricurvus sp. TaxID=2004510 RepID=UPI003F6CC8CA